MQPGRLQIGKSRQFRQKRKTRKHRKINASGSRSGGIRTRGLLVPNQTRYQTALHLANGADEGTRTPDLLITNRLLYQLSHIGTTSKRYYSKAKMVCPALFLLFAASPVPRRKDREAVDSANGIVLNCFRTKQREGPV